MAILGTIAGTLPGVIILLFRALIHLPLEFLLPGNRSENFEALAPWMHFALPTAGAVGLGYLASRIRSDALPVGLGVCRTFPKDTCKRGFSTSLGA